MSRILIVEKDHFVRCKIVEMLDSLGHELIVFDCGQEGFEYFEKNIPDLVILNENLSDMIGFELCRKIKEHANGFSTPVIMLLEDKKNNVIDGVNAGADYYLLKPLNEEHLIASLKTSLKSSAFHKEDFELVKNHVTVDGRYYIIKLIGYGSHSAVFLASDSQNNGACVAVKLLKKEFSSNSPTAEKFLKIAAKIKQINSPVLIKIYDTGIWNERIFVVMEYAERGDIMLAIKRKNFPELKAVNMGLDILQSIKLLQEHKIYHLDIKPQNILRIGKRYKLSDFGVAVYHHDKSDKPDVSDVWNAAAYLSPEHLYAEGKISSQSDIYSLGVTIYQAVTGDNPFDATKPSATVLRHLNMVPSWPHECNSGISKYLSEAIMAMLIKDPDYRPSVDELIKYFTQLKKYLEFYYKKTKAQETQQSKQRPITETIDLTPEEAESIRKAVETSVDVNAEMDNIKPFKNLDQWRLLSINGKELSACFSRKAIIFTAITLTLLFILSVWFGLFTYRQMEERRMPVNLKEGPMAVIKCFKCGLMNEVRVKNISEKHCKKCNGSVGYAMKCGKCNKIFPQRQLHASSAIGNKSIVKVNEYMYKCPDCGAMDTRPMLTAEEQQHEQKKAAQSKYNKTMLKL